MVEIETIVRLIVVMVALVVVILLVVNFLPSEATKSLSTVVNLMPEVEVKLDPCINYCYQQAEQSELNLIKPPTPTGYDGPKILADYASAIRTPTYFSCNYEMLKVATLAIEMGRYEQGSPVKYYDNISCTDGLKVYVPGDIIPIKNVCEVGFKKSTPIVRDCILWKQDDKILKLTCPSAYCKVNELTFSLDWKCDIKAVGSGGNNDITDPNAINLVKDICSSCPSGATWCSAAVDVGKFFLGHGLFCINFDPDCKSTGLRSGVYTGSDIIDCEMKCVDNNGKKPDCKQIGGCKILFENGLVDCEDSRSCTIDLTKLGDDYEYDGATNKLTYNGDDCVILYQPGDCEISCSESHGSVDISSSRVIYDFVRKINGEEVYPIVYYDPNSPFTSSGLFAEFNGFKILKAYFPAGSDPIDYLPFSVNTLAGLGISIGQRFGLLMKPQYEILFPRNRIVTPQDNLRKHYIKFGFLNQNKTKTFLQSFRGAVTNPYYFENATFILYNCLAGIDCKEGKELYAFNYLRNIDTFLKSYDYINQLSKLTLSDYVNPDYFTYHYRPGDDITNGFYCSIGSDVCNYDNSIVNDDCQPAWATMIGRTGRCEDRAIMDYTLFKTMGVPEYDGTNQDLYVKLDMDYCTPPCACQYLADHCASISINQEECATGQQITLKMGSKCDDADGDGEPDVDSNGECTSIVDNLFSYNACPPTITNYPTGWDGRWLNGSRYTLSVGSKDFTVIQDFNKKVLKCGADYCRTEFIGGKLFVKCSGARYDACTKTGSSVECTSPSSISCEFVDNPFYYPVYLAKRFGSNPTYYSGSIDRSCINQDHCQSCDGVIIPKDRDDGDENLIRDCYDALYDTKLTYDDFKAQVIGSCGIIG